MGDPISDGVMALGAGFCGDAGTWNDRALAVEEPPKLRSDDELELTVPR